MRMTATEGLKLVMAVGMLVTGQVLWKLGLTDIGAFSLTRDFVGSMARAGTNPKILGGLLLYAFSTLVYFDVLSKLPLSLVYPFMSLSYVLALVPAYFILGETITVLRLVGILVICSGIVLLVRS